MKVLLFDIETAPSLAYIWGLWQEVRDMSMVEEDWYVLCWAAKWLGEKKVHSSALTDFKDYDKDNKNDKKILEKLWVLLDEADVVIAHNGIKFDRRKINARFIKHGLNPPSPYKTIDTLLVARKEFAFSSNRLNDISKFLGLGQKLDSGGFSTWRACMNGDIKAWNKMVKYCQRDVKQLEKVYLKLRPYIAIHPNAGIYSETEETQCPKCGSCNIQYRGYAYTNLSKFHQFKCNDCGSWGRQRINQCSTSKRKNLATNISS